MYERAILWRERDDRVKETRLFVAVGNAYIRQLCIHTHVISSTQCGRLCCTILPFQLLNHVCLPGLFLFCFPPPPPSSTKLEALETQKEAKCLSWAGSGRRGSATTPSQKEEEEGLVAVGDLDDDGGITKEGRSEQERLSEVIWQTREEVWAWICNGRE